MHPQQPGEELPDEPVDEPVDESADAVDPVGADGTEDVWQSIIDNYGERAQLESDELPAERQPEPAQWSVFSADDDEPEELEEEADYDAFVPPEPPPIPRPPTDRLIAWLGIFGAPALLLVFVITGIHPPTYVSGLLVAAFIGGFLYLVVKMSPEPRDPNDTGAQL